MNRPIKFRAWKKKEMQMFMITHLSFMKNSTGSAEDRGCEGYYGDNHRDRFSLDDIELMQFTGLLDKNGKEIYEGDIVRVWVGEHEVREKVVEWEKEELSWSIGGYHGFDYDIFEVIGNIYENPELIK